MSGPLSGGRNGCDSPDLPTELGWAGQVKKGWSGVQPSSREKEGLKVIKLLNVNPPGITIWCTHIEPVLFGHSVNKSSVYVCVCVMSLPASAAYLLHLHLQLPSANCNSQLYISTHVTTGMGKFEWVSN